MVQLFIEGREVELKDDLNILFTYETIDPDKLSSIKNSFTKTVSIPGTPNNNSLFGDIYRNDRYIGSNLVPQGDYGEVKNIGFQYDPHKKADYVLLSNGSLISSGYCTLNSISYKDQIEITYNITLYGGLGNFFYNLKNNEDGTPKTLYDMYWNWEPRIAAGGYGNPMTRFEEDNKIIFVADARNVANAWNKLAPMESFNEVDTSDDPLWYNEQYDEHYKYTEIDKDVVLMPMYSGKYENFDHKHMIVSTFNSTSQREYLSQDNLERWNTAFPDQKRGLNPDYDPDDPDSEQYITYGTLDSAFQPFPTGVYRYGIATFSRDLDPWEAGDLRVNELPVGIRLSKVMRTLSEPWNNGGYKVEWDPEITESPYWNYGWIGLGKVKQELENPPIYYATVSSDTVENKVVATYDNHLDPVVTYTIPAGYNISEEITFNIPNWTINPEHLIFSEQYHLSVTPSDISFLASAGGRNLFSGNTGRYLHGQAGVYIPDTKSIKRTTINYHIVLTQLYDGATLISNKVDIMFFVTENIQSYFGELGTNKLHTNLHTLYQNLIQNLNAQFSINLTEEDITPHTIILKVKDYHTPNYTFFDINERLSIKIPANTTNPVIKQNRLTAWALYYNRKFRVPDYSDIDLFKTGIYGIDSPLNYGFTNWPWTRSAYNSLFSDYNINKDQSESYFEESSLSFSTTIDYHIITNPNISTGFNILKLDKKKLFADSASPFDYLASFCKMMNYRFILANNDPYNIDGVQKIKIMPMKKYYLNTVKNIEERVDYSRDYSIKPVFWNYNIINFSLDTPETYASYIFNKTSREKFNTAKYDTKVEYNLNPTSLMDDNIFKNTIDWAQSSVYYNIWPQLPRAYDTQTVSWSLFNLAETNPENITTEEFINYSAPSTDLGLLSKTDFLPKVAAFDKEDALVSDVFPTLFMLNGFVKNYDYNKVGSVFLELTPDSITDNRYIVQSSGNTGSSTNYQIWQYDNIDTNATYRFSGQGPSNSAQAFINYYDSNNQFIGYEFHIADAPTLVNAEFHPIAGTATIKINMRKTYQSSYKLEKGTDKYVIHPRVTLSNDLPEQYYFVGDRCYMYDFKYNDNFTPWGCYSNDKKGTAVSWVIPFFTRDLYNSYVAHETFVYETVRLDVSRTYDNTKFLDDGTTQNNSNWCQYEFVFPQEDENTEIVSATFTAKYPATESGWAIWERTIYGSNVRYEGNFTTSGQHEFPDAAINLSPGEYGLPPRNIRMNTYKAMQGDDNYYIDVTLKRREFYYDWAPNDSIIASWNLVRQTGLYEQSSPYNRSEIEFIKEPRFSYAKTVTDTSLIDANSYYIDNWNSDVDNTVFSTLWYPWLNDYYNRNAREITCYVDLNGFGQPNNILRQFYFMNGFTYVITKIENYNCINSHKDRFTKVTLHRVDDMANWTNL